MTDLLQAIAGMQAAYFFLTGIWPIVHIRSFMAVTGPKTDLWLVRTVGGLVGIVGIVLAVSAWRGTIGLEIMILAIGCAAALTAVDVIYVARGTIARIYLLDAAAEIVLIIAWTMAWFIR